MGLGDVAVGVVAGADVGASSSEVSADTMGSVGVGSGAGGTDAPRHQHKVTAPHPKP